MLNVKALTELLSKNSDARLYKRWYLMTPNGTLLAYNQPTNIRDLRREAAVATLTWQEHVEGLTGSQSRPDDESSISKTSIPLHTLTMETEAANVIIRQLQPDLLLVLEGGVPPRKRTFQPRITAENVSGAILGQKVAESGLESSASSVAESSRSSSSAASQVLTLQRKKLDAMASAMIEDFEATGFKMPEDSINKLF